MGIPRGPGRTLVGVDFSLAALALARRHGTFDALVCADIRRLPVRNEAAVGVWNLGVMEHFEPPVAHRILLELARVLDRSQGRLVLFWPPTFGLSRWVLAPFEWIRSLATGHRFRFYPDEVFRLRSRAEARATLDAAGIDAEQVRFGPRDGFNHLIVVGRRRR
jgi:hypothetical protein